MDTGFDFLEEGDLLDQQLDQPLAAFLGIGSFSVWSAIVFVVIFIGIIDEASKAVGHPTAFIERAISEVQRILKRT